MSSEEKLLVEDLFKTFLKRISEKPLFTDKDHADIAEVILNLDDIELPDAIISLKYYKKVTKQKEVKNMGKRLTYKESYLTDKEDIKKIRQSASANYTQLHDAYLVRKVLERGGIYAIHDCFLIDCLNVTYIVALVNEGMRETPHDLGLNKKPEDIKKIFSIFIII